MRDCKTRRFALRLIVRTGLGMGFIVLGAHTFGCAISIAECGTPWYIGVTASFGSAVLAVICGALFAEV